MPRTQNNPNDLQTASGAETALDIADLAISQDGNRVFGHVSLRIFPGEIFGLIGVNGAGKTSLMKAVVNLIEPEAGQVRIFGVLNHAPASRRPAAYLPESFRPPANMTGAQFLRLALGFHDIKFDRNLADKLALAAGMAPALLDMRIARLSKGNGQKIGLLAVLLTGCPLLMLDEPMEGLDPHARILLKALLQAHRAEGKTIFLSSHILTDLEELCDRIALLHMGRLVFTGPPAALLRQYRQTNFEAAFLAAISPAEPRQ